MDEYDLPLGHPIDRLQIARRRLERLKEEVEFCPFSHVEGIRMPSRVTNNELVGLRALYEIPSDII